MLQENMKDYMDKIITLEKRLGSRLSYRMMEPFNIVNCDFIEIQKAARKIAEFLGLSWYTFIVIPANQGKNVGGKIELKEGQKEVFIELSYEVLEFKEAVIATLAHEITHKYMHVHGIHIPQGSGYFNEYEVFTDIAAVFLGLGKLMLNGYECTRDNVAGSGNTGAIVEKLKVGYLDNEQLALVYLIVCLMRNIPQIEYQKGISQNQLKTLMQCKKEYEYYFKDHYKEYESKAELLESLKNWNAREKSALNGIDQCHDKLSNMICVLDELISEDEYDPCLKKLYIIKINVLVEEISSELKRYSLLIDKYKVQVSRLRLFLKTISNPSFSTMNAKSIKALFKKLFI